MKYEKPCISVIIPTLNRCHTLKRAIDSVLQQSFQPEEIIIVDNGSQDGTAKMVTSCYPSVKFLSEDKRGVSAARNLGIKASKGRWLALLDSDDEWYPKKLERQANICANFSTSFRLIHTNEEWKKDGVLVNQMKKHKKNGGNIFLACLPICCISPSSTLLRKDIFQDIGYFDENLPACEDYDLWLRICSKEEVFFINENLIVKHGGHSDQLSRKYWAMDRFRVYSLEKLINSGELSIKNDMAAKKMLISKINVLIKGGVNRKNFPLVDFYAQKKDYWLSVIDGSKKHDSVYMKESSSYYSQ